MKILAIEKEVPGINWDNESITLEREARQVFQLYLSDALREIYFTDEHVAILILECENKEKARQLLDTLPLVQKKLIDFEIMQLLPYTGYERIIR